MSGFPSSRQAALRGCFVTGTDTGVGKTWASAALLHALGAQGWRVAGLKPVAAGAEPGEDGAVNEDVHALRRASNVPVSDAEVGPCQLRTACAPHLAARIEGVSISRAALLGAARALAQRAELLVVEGVGGFRVPLGDHGDVYDRYMLRILEMRETVKILQQALRSIPDGPVISPKAKLRGFKPPAGESYGRIEAPKGELGFYLISDGTPNPTGIACARRASST